MQNRRRNVEWFGSVSYRIVSSHHTTIETIVWLRDDDEMSVSINRSLADAPFAFQCGVVWCGVDWSPHSLNRFQSNRYSSSLQSPKQPNNEQTSGALVKHRIALHCTAAPSPSPSASHIESTDKWGNLHILYAHLRSLLLSSPLYRSSIQLFRSFCPLTHLNWLFDDKCFILPITRIDLFVPFV